MGGFKVGIGNLINSPIVSIGSECTISETILFFHTQRVQALFVEESDRFVGLVVKSDLVDRINRGEMAPETTLVGETMERPIPCLDCQSSVQEANEFMRTHRIRYVAVTEDRQIIGILSLQDLNAYFR
jgi:predicted transcriptional regulator